MSTPPREDRPMDERPPGATPDERTVGELVVDISEQASSLIREEIELAKAEVSEKVNKILRGSVAGIAAGVFVVMALAMLMHGIAWLFAYRSIKAGAPPTPDMAIEEARKAKETFEAEASGGEFASELAGPE